MGGGGYRFIDKVDNVFLCVEKYNYVTKLNSYQLKVYWWSKFNLLKTIIKYYILKKSCTFYFPYNFTSR